MQEESKIFTKRFNLLFLTNMTVFLVFYALITVFPLYVVSALKGTQDQAGLLVTVFMISAIVVRPFSAKFLDVFGKKKLLVIGAVFYLICTAFYAVVDEFSLLLVIRFMQGIWFSVVTTGCMSLAAEIVPKQRKGAGLGYFIMSSNLAIVLGPFLGLFLIQLGNYEVLFTILGIIMLLGTLCAVSINTDDLKPVDPNAKLKFTLNDLFEKKALSVAFIGLAVAFSYTTVLSFISLYAEDKNLLDVASYFYLVFAVAMLGIRPFTNKIYDSKGPKMVAIPAFIVFAFGLFLLSTINSPIGLLACAAVIGMGYGSLATTLQTQAVQKVTISRSSYATATYFTLFDVGIAIGSYVFGMIILYIDFSYIYQIGALIMIVITFVYVWLSHKNVHNTVQ